VGMRRFFCSVLAIIAIILFIGFWWGQLAQPPDPLFTKIKMLMLENDPRRVGRGYSEKLSAYLCPLLNEEILNKWNENSFLWPEVGFLDLPNGGYLIPPNTKRWSISQIIEFETNIQLAIYLTGEEKTCSIHLYNSSIFP
jgi:hypothetical protein